MSQCSRPQDLVAHSYDAIAERYAAWTGDELTGARAQSVALLQREVPSGAPVLDLGCGTGVPVSRALAAQYRVTGVDGSGRSIALARQNVLNAAFLQADMTQVEFPAESFAAVISCYAIIHVPRAEHAALLRRIAGWLQPGGLLLATMGAAAAEGTEDDWLGAPMYFSHFDAATNERLVVEAGLELVEAVLDAADEDGESVTHQWIVARKPH
ncbi:MAG: methyltransferase domain-containing protein [Thermomicrobiales bacterium]|nr:methyltransferase domain-containing protein [Thermomicrobiales bacterium]